MPTAFLKMNGAGNDFIIFDARKTPLTLSAEQVRALASRSNATTKGCDQLIVIEPSARAEVFMRIYNADGSEVDACGNATRCVGSLVLAEQKILNVISVETKAGILRCTPWTGDYYGKGADVIVADMGSPRFMWKDIPLSRAAVPDELKNIAQNYGIAGFQKALCVGMGNPHVVFFVSETPKDNALVQFLGKKLPNQPLFASHGVNITVANANGSTIESYVYERGVGITASCGTAACATAVAAIELGYRTKNTDIHIRQLQKSPLDLFVRWDEKTNAVKLIGPVEKEFSGSVAI